MVCGSCASHGRECYDCYKWCVGHVRVMEGSVMIVTNGVGHVRVMEGSVMIVTNGVWVMCESWECYDGVWVMCESWKGVL